MKQFGPIIEIGAGNGYWARMLQMRDVDIIAFDLHATSVWFPVQEGTPEILSEHKDRTLFLCYPDDFEESEDSMALSCLQAYTGTYIIHVGEMLGQTLCLPDPWGRTSAPDFQVHLATVFHKILQVPLPAWHSSLDTLTVWKRTETCVVDGAMYAHIPAKERLEYTMASPSTRQYLLPTTASETKDASKKRKSK